MKKINILCVDDELQNREDLSAILNDEIIENHILKVETLDSFENAFEQISQRKYHIIILDIFQGKPEDNGNKLGIDVLAKIQDNLFFRKCRFC